LFYCGTPSFPDRPPFPILPPTRPALKSCKLGPLDVGLLSFEDIYRVMAVNEVKKICNAKFQKAQNSSPSILNLF
jgi:hypothetical protein